MDEYILNNKRINSYYIQVLFSMRTLAANYIAYNLQTSPFEIYLCVFCNKPAQSAHLSWSPFKGGTYIQ